MPFYLSQLTFRPRKLVIVIIRAEYILGHLLHPLIVGMICHNSQCVIGKIDSLLNCPLYAVEEGIVRAFGENVSGLIMNGFIKERETLTVSRVDRVLCCKAVIGQGQKQGILKFHGEMIAKLD